jgi:hypothetical protein
MMATVKENLIAARALIDTPEKWVQEKYIDGDGCMCAAGAIRKATGERLGETECWLDLFVRREFYCDFGFATIEEFNDDRMTTHADIMALFDRAIAAQEPSHD